MHIFPRLDLVTLPFGAHAQNSPDWAVLPEVQKGVEHDPLVCEATVDAGGGASVMAGLALSAMEVEGLVTWGDQAQVLAAFSI